MKRTAAANLALAFRGPADLQADALMVTANQNADDDTSSGELRGVLRTRTLIRAYIEGGNATITIQSKATNERFTFRFRQPKHERDPRHHKPIWVSVLTGSDNNTCYSFIGSIFPDRSTTEIRPSQRSKVGLDADSAKAVAWLLRQVYLGTNDEALFGRATIWHEGRCGRCGRKLTVPESVSSGFGPECITRI